MLLKEEQEEEQENNIIDTIPGNISQLSKLENADFSPFIIQYSRALENEQTSYIMMDCSLVVDMMIR